MSGYQWLLRVLLVGTIIFASGACNGSPDESRGFPPLAVESFDVSLDKIPALRENLKRFAETEHLNYFEGGFPKQGRQVSQFYFKKNSRPVFYVDNFRNPIKFEATAYSGNSEGDWTPRWLRLLVIIRSVSAGN
jgi:hypothetical protein